MADTAKRLYGPAQLGTSAATLYTVPAATLTIIRYIRIANPLGNVVAVTMSIGANAAATQFFAATNVPANGYLDWSGFIPMTATEIIQGLASMATALTVIIAGVEVT
jgi:hypothetical protein